MSSFKLFGFKRKLEVFCFLENFFELHNSATEGKEQNRVENSIFFSNLKKFKGVQ